MPACRDLSPQAGSRPLLVWSRTCTAVNPERLHADLLKVPHHGGDTNAPGFLAAVGARAELLAVDLDAQASPPPARLQ